jgi:hypothetical protein
VAQAVECLLCKYEVLNSNPRPTKKIKERKQEWRKYERKRERNREREKERERERERENSLTRSYGPKVAIYLQCWGWYPGLCKCLSRLYH